MNLKFEIGILTHVYSEYLHYLILEIQLVFENLEIEIRFH